MKWLLLISLLLPFQNIVYSQESMPPNKKTFRIKVYDQQSQNRQGYLQNIGDSSLTLSLAPTKYGETGKGKLISYPEISSITIKRKGNAARGVIIGALSGFLIGTIIGYASGDDPVGPFRYTAEQKAMGGGILLSGAGAAVSGVTGALIKKKFIINGKNENFEAMRMQTLDKIYVSPKN